MRAFVLFIFVKLLLLQSCMQGTTEEKSTEGNLADSMSVNFECYSCSEVVYVLGQTSSNVAQINQEVERFGMFSLGTSRLEISSDARNAIHEFMYWQYRFLSPGNKSIDFKANFGYRGKQESWCKLTYNGMTYQDGKHHVAYIVQYRNRAGGVMDNYMMNDEKLLALGFKDPTPGQLLSPGDFVDVKKEGQEGFRAVIWQYVYSANINHHLTIEFRDEQRVLAKENIVSCMETWFMYKDPLIM